MLLDIRAVEQRFCRGTSKPRKQKFFFFWASQFFYRKLVWTKPSFGKGPKVKTGKQRICGLSNSAKKMFIFDKLTDPHSLCGCLDQCYHQLTFLPLDIRTKPPTRSLMNDSTEPDHSPRRFLAPHHCLSLIYGQQTRLVVGLLLGHNANTKKCGDK